MLGLGLDLELTAARGAGAVPAGTIRQSSVTPFGAANSFIQTLSGAKAGDYCVIFSSAGFDTVVPGGWTTLDQPTTGSNWNGATFAKVLGSGDISTGSVTITYGGSFNGVVGCVVFVGSMTGLRAKASIRGANGAQVTGALTTNGTPVAGDIALYWCSDTPGPQAITLDRGATLQQQTGAGSNAILAKETLAAGGAQTLNGDYHEFVTGHYSINLILQR